MSPTVIDDTVQQILTARVYEVAGETPLQKAHKLSKITGATVYLKREDLQPVHSFKLRGAYNKMSQLTAKERAKGVITASAGNHAQGVAMSARKLSISALIVMPRTTPHIKVQAVKSYGANVELYGDSYSEAAEHCKQRVKETGRTYIHPFDDPLVIAGQGTIGREIIEQLPEVTHIFVPVGGGGLLAGIAAYVSAIKPDVSVVGVEPEDSSAMAQSVQLGERVTLRHVGIFADGVAVKQVGEHTFDIVKHKVDDCIVVSTDQICSAIKDVFEETRSIVEPAGALGIAGIMQYDLPPDAHAVAICSGANITFERLQQVAERTLLGSGKEAMFAVTLPERPGALHDFCTHVVNGFNISEFNYRLSSRDQATILVGINIADEADKEKLTANMRQYGYKHIDLTHDELTKAHLRHMIGGPALETEDEHIYEVIFPERPGALVSFLEAMGENWNISLFHYRSTASDSGSVLIGFESKSTQALDQKLAGTEFEFTEVSDRNAIALFTGQN